MKPLAIVAILALKSHAEYVRANDRLEKIIKINKGNVVFYNGYNQCVLKALPRSLKKWQCGAKN